MRTEIVGDEVEIRGECGVGRLRVREELTLTNTLSVVDILGSMNVGFLNVGGISSLYDVEVQGNLEVGGNVVNGLLYRDFTRSCGTLSSMTWVTRTAYGQFDFSDCMGQAWQISEDGDIGEIDGSGNFLSKVTGLIEFTVRGNFRTPNSSGNTLALRIFENSGVPGTEIGEIHQFYNYEAGPDDKYYTVNLSCVVPVSVGNAYLLYLQAEPAVDTTQWRPKYGFEFRARKI